MIRAAVQHIALAGWHQSADDGERQVGKSLAPCVQQPGNSPGLDGQQQLEILAIAERLLQRATG